jgi:hypothetical protein
MTYGEAVTHYTYWRAMDRWNRGHDPKPRPIGGASEAYVWYYNAHLRPERLP